MSLADLVYQKRAAEELSVRELARTIGCNPMVISRVENGEAPSVPNLAKIILWLKEKPAVIIEAIKEFA